LRIDKSTWHPYFRSYTEDKASSSESVIPVIAPQLRVASDKVEDIQLCYAVKLPDGEHHLCFKDKDHRDNVNATKRFVHSPYSVFTIFLLYVPFVLLDALSLYTAAYKNMPHICKYIQSLT
jgi:hypothetical protein